MYTRTQRTFWRYLVDAPIAIILSRIELVQRWYSTACDGVCSTLGSSAINGVPPPPAALTAPLPGLGVPFPNCGCVPGLGVVVVRVLPLVSPPLDDDEAWALDADVKLIIGTLTSVPLAVVTLSAGLGVASTPTAFMLLPLAPPFPAPVPTLGITTPGLGRFNIRRSRCRGSLGAGGMLGSGTNPFSTICRPRLFARPSSPLELW
jgi:hypothetical protein